jgi:hypothetical protein
MYFKKSVVNTDWWQLLDLYIQIGVEIFFFREQTLPNKNNPHPDLTDPSLDQADDTLGTYIAEAHTALNGQPSESFKPSIFVGHSAHR